MYYIVSYFYNRVLPKCKWGYHFLERPTVIVRFLGTSVQLVVHPSLQGFNHLNNEKIDFRRKEK